MKRKLKMMTLILMLSIFAGMTMASGLNVVNNNSFNNAINGSWPVESEKPDCFSNNCFYFQDNNYYYSGDWVYQADAKEFITIRTQDVSRNVISNYDHSGSLQFSYYVYGDGAEEFGIRIRSDFTNGGIGPLYQLFLLVSSIGTEGGDYKIISSDVSTGSWKVISINVYDFWIAVGNPVDAEIVEISLFVADYGNSSGNTRVFLDDIILDASSGNTGGPGGGPPRYLTPF